MSEHMRNWHDSELRQHFPVIGVAIVLALYAGFWFLSGMAVVYFWGAQ